MPGRSGGGDPGFRGRGGAGRQGGPHRPPEITGRRDSARLADELDRMDGASYGRYKSLTGDWDFGDFTLTVQRVQADPFAPPSRIGVRIPASTAGLPERAWADPVRRRATADHLVRVAHRALKGARLRIDAGGQQVIERAAGRIEDGAVVLNLGIELPGHGRRIDGRSARSELCERLGAMVGALRWDALDTGRADGFADTVEDSAALRDALPGLGLVAFVADGSVLPRASGVSDRPMDGDAVPFASPAELRTSVVLPHAGEVHGMGVPEGITLIVGGGFHGKSTLLHALERGVYDHVPGDGRERVATRADAVKIRAEEGRRVERTDVSAFVSDLPTGADTRRFSTGNASGSTSQAANIAEALEAGSRTLLVDEDTTATNLMIRDARMQRLVHGDREPLRPFVDLIRPLHREHGVSTVLVMGGSGDYFDVADRVVMFDAYRPFDVTEQARALAADRADAAFSRPADRAVDPASVDATARGRTRIKRRDMDVLTFGESEIDVRGLTQFVDPGQLIGAGLAMRMLVEHGLLGRGRTLAEALDALDALLDGGADGAPGGAALLGRGHSGDFAMPRRHEIAGALNRLRTLRVADER